MDSSHASLDKRYMLNDTDSDSDENTKTPAINTMPSTPSTLYSITHLIIGVFAVYLAWKCNGGFNLGAFLIACFCPYLYIIYAFAVNGGCGVLENI